VPILLQKSPKREASETEHAAAHPGASRRTRFMEDAQVRFRAFAPLNFSELL